MASEKEPHVGVVVEEQAEGAFDLLHVTLPVPRLLCLPEETRQHLRAARRERRLAVRSLFDAARKRRRDEGDKPRRRAERVKVE
jgi:hypothetical protein